MGSKETPYKTLQFQIDTDALVLPIEEAMIYLITTEGQKMSKKLSIIRFKPKPEHYDQFLADVIENGKDREPNTHFTVTAGDEVIAVVIRDADSFEESAKDGVVNWLDERRPMLQEFDAVNRHTIPLSGDLVE